MQAHRLFPVKALAALIPLFLGAVALLAPAAAVQEKRVSKLGEYAGYSKPVYTDVVRTSQYVPTRDGTRLAVDIFRPVENGQPVATKLPLVWTHMRYQRAYQGPNGKIVTLADRAPYLNDIVKHGYIVAAVDCRGSGASFGAWEGSFSEKESQDAYDVTEWFAAQPYCDGKIGMYGVSYLGATQYTAASKAPPHLKAIFPQRAPFDRYALLYPNGVFHKDFSEYWGKNVKALDMNFPPAPVAGRVDEDKDGKLLAAATKEHKLNRPVLELAIACPFRDSPDPVTKEMAWPARGPFVDLEAVRKSKVAIYHLGGWKDTFTRDTIQYYKNLDNPAKLVMGPWTHTQSHELDYGAEHLRWYDFWLKGIDNGIMKEAPIHYYTINMPEGSRWRAAKQWPLPEQQLARFYLQGGKSQSIKSINDGTLSTQAPKESSGSDTYTVDYTTSSGKPSRWSNGYAAGGKEFNYGDMTANDQKGLTYTTAPLDADTEVTGHPVIHLWVTSTAKDGNFFAYLEDIDAKGVSNYVTEGIIRASHRGLDKPGFNNLGLPYHRSFAKDVADLPNEPVELVFDMPPTSIVFPKGHRIRVTVTCADKDNCETVESSPEPKVTLYRDKDRASHIVLPVIGGK